MLGKFCDRIHRDHSGTLTLTGPEPGPGSAATFACAPKSGAAGPGADSRTAVACAAEPRAYASAGTDTEPAANGWAFRPVIAVTDTT